MTVVMSATLRRFHEVVNIPNGTLTGGEYPRRTLGVLPGEVLIVDQPMNAMRSAQKSRSIVSKWPLLSSSKNSKKS